MSVPLPSVTVYAGGSAPTFGMGSVASFTSRSENVVVAQVEETDLLYEVLIEPRHGAICRRATAPVRRRFHPEEKTASPSPSVRPGGRTPTTLTRRLLGIGVTHVTAAPGRTDLRKKKPRIARGRTGIVHTGGIECVPSCDGERLTEMEGSRRAAIPWLNAAASLAAPGTWRC